MNNLKKVGIFHETPESAAKHIISVWDDVNSWWNDSLTKKYVKDFCKMYALYCKTM